MSEHLSERLIDDFVAGELDSTTRAAAEAHLDACASCRERASEYRSFFTALEHLPVPEPPAGFAVRILDAVLPARVKERKIVRVVTRAYAGVAVALSAVAAAALGVTGPGPFSVALAEGWSHSVEDGLVVLRSSIVSGVDVVLAVLELAPLARVGPLLVDLLETITLALPPQHMALLVLSVSLAILVLAWAMAPRRERGVPHVSLVL